MRLEAAFFSMMVAAVGILLTLAQALRVLLHRRRRRVSTFNRPGISILKPLCGNDDILLDNLESFATLSYPNYEVLLGVRDAQDDAYVLARAAVRRWPGRMRILLQRGEPGLNPKVNQLITLAKGARYDLLLVSDSNVRAREGYLEEVAAHFEDPDVGCVTNPLVGEAEESLGSLMDSLHMAGSIGPAMITAPALGLDLVIGKSMALRRRDLERLGGFLSVKDVLAEDHVLGCRVVSELQKRVAVAQHPIQNVSRSMSLWGFFKRQQRWAVTQRTSLRPWKYLSLALTQPIPFALFAMAILPERFAIPGVAACAAKAVLDASVASALRQKPYARHALLAVLLKDLLLFAAWIHGAFSATVTWRGNRLRVVWPSRLVPLEDAEGIPTARQTLHPTLENPIL